MTSVLGTGAPPRCGDGRETGSQLARRLAGFRGSHPVVVGIAPGGMAIAAAVARALEAPLEAVAVQPLTLGDAGGEHFGTAAEGGIVLFDRERREELDSESGAEAVDAVLLEAEARLQQRAASWHERHRRQALRGRVVLLVAEPLTDGQVAAAAACAVRDRGAAEVVYVTPQAEVADVLAAVDWMDEIVCLELRERDRARR